MYKAYTLYMAYESTDKNLGTTKLRIIPRIKLKILAIRISNQQKH